MSFFDTFRGKRFKSELDQAKAERDALKATLATTEHLTNFELQQMNADLTATKEKLISDIDILQASYARQKQELEQQISGFQRKLQAQNAELERSVREKRQELVDIDDHILLQSFGIYTPKYDLKNSEAYKTRLDQVRKQQETMVKEGRATIAPTNWTVNNSKAEGERMVKDYVKLIVRSFNNECDASIVNVKFNNVETIEKRIRKAFETLNTLGKRINITLVPDYLNLKLQELYLCHEYQVKKQEEREKLRQQREEEREEAKRAREIEAQKLKIAKEATHFARALININAQIEKATNDAERELFVRERDAIQAKLAETEHNLEDILRLEQNTRAGHVYIISNVGAFGENVFKIGVTRRLDPKERIWELGDASVPFDFDIHALIFSDDAPALENALHRKFEDRRINLINRRREFFRVTLQEVEEVVKQNFKKPFELMEEPDAAEYR